MKTSLSLRSNTRRFIGATLTVLIAFGALIADTVSKQRDAATNITIELCRKAANGQWEVIDRAKGPANFSASIAEVASGKELTSPINWTVRSDKGRQINVKLARAARVVFNPAAGLLTLDAPFDATVNGTRVPLNVKLTTESISSPSGQLVGKRADLNVSARTLTAGLVGFTSIKQRDVIDKILLSDEARAGKLGDQSKTKKEAARNLGAVAAGNGVVDEIVVVFKGDGRVVAR